MKKLTDQKIVSSWKKNAQPWVDALREGEIESRLLVTNQAVIDAILACNPKTALDVGCGEGWLSRTLEKSGIKAMGIDVVPELIDAAEKEGGGRFKTIAYEQLSVDILKEKFDVVVCNFSLLGDESVNNVFRQVPGLLKNGGFFIIQTIHPVAGNGKEDYKDGWRTESWDGFSNEFCDPAPWYFRTLATWKKLFSQNGFKLHKLLEPLHPKTKKPASVIFVGRLANP